MKISGYGDYQQLRKASQKDSASIKEDAERAEHGGDEVNTSDAITISPEARRRGKLRMASDYRQDKVADVKARFEDGTLVNSEALKSGTRKMLEGMFAGDL